MLRRFLKALFVPLYALLREEEPTLLVRYRKLPAPPKEPEFPKLQLYSRSVHTDTLKLPIPRKPPPLKR